MYFSKKNLKKIIFPHAAKTLPPPPLPLIRGKGKLESCPKKFKQHFLGEEWVKFI
jgi:hypothetical protein